MNLRGRGFWRELERPCNCFIFCLAPSQVTYMLQSLIALTGFGGVSIYTIIILYYCSSDDFTAIKFAILLSHTAVATRNMKYCFRQIGFTLKTCLPIFCVASF